MNDVCVKLSAFCEYAACLRELNNNNVNLIHGANGVEEKRNKKNYIQKHKNIVKNVFTWGGGNSSDIHI